MINPTSSYVLHMHQDHHHHHDHHGHHPHHAHHDHHGWRTWCYSARWHCRTGAGTHGWNRARTKATVVRQPPCAPSIIVIIIIITIITIITISSVNNLVD